jgi:hypothetical protein
MSGYTDDAIILHRVLEPKMHFLEKCWPARCARCSMRPSVTSDTMI